MCMQIFSLNSFFSMFGRVKIIPEEGFSITRMTDSYVKNVSNIVFMEDNFSEESFKNSVQVDPRDHEVNPLEDFYIIDMFLKGYSIDEICLKLHRNTRSITLRLRLFLGINHSFRVCYDNMTNENRENALQLINLFKGRALTFLAYCEDVLLVDEIKKTFDEKNDDRVFAVRVNQWSRTKNVLNLS